MATMESAESETSSTSFGRELGDALREESEEATSHEKGSGSPENTSAGRQHELSRLQGLRTEVLVRILSFLPPRDLATVSKVSRTLRTAAAEPVLWQMAFLQRFGKRGGAHESIDWRDAYKARDKEEMEDAKQKAPEGTEEQFLDMVRGQRAQAPGKQVEAVDEMLQSGLLSAGCVPQSKRKRRSFGNEAEENAWRARMGLPNPPSDKDHVCDSRFCRFHRIGETLLCERTGKAHVCGEHCKERIFDRSQGDLVCRITGKCFQCLDSELREGFDEEEPHEEADFGERGRLGRAYLGGYLCHSEKELQAFLRGR